MDHRTMYSLKEMSIFFLVGGLVCAAFLILALLASLKIVAAVFSCLLGFCLICALNFLCFHKEKMRDKNESKG